MQKSITSWADYIEWCNPVRENTEVTPTFINLYLGLSLAQENQATGQNAILVTDWPNITCHTSQQSCFLKSAPFLILSKGYFKYSPLFSFLQPYYSLLFTLIDDLFFSDVNPLPPP